MGHPRHCGGNIQRGDGGSIYISLFLPTPLFIFGRSENPPALAGGMNDRNIISFLLTS